MSGIPERLALVKDIPLTAGSHSRPLYVDENCAPGAFCLLEKHAFVTGQRWSDTPDNCCTTIGAYGRRVNDRCSQEMRDRIDEWWMANIDRIVKTAHDGHQRARGFILMDHAIRVALAARLDTAKRPEAADRLRALPVIVDRASSDAAVRVVREIRKTLPAGWEWRLTLRMKYRDAILAAMKDRPDADADAVAVAAAVAVAVADADADADSYWERRRKVYDAVYPILRARYARIYGEPADPTIVLARLVACGGTAA